jgi:putative transposase
MTSSVVARLQAMLEAELDEVLARSRYARGAKSPSGGSLGITGHRHGHRSRSLLGTFGKVTVECSARG